MKRMDSDVLRAIDGGINPFNLKFICEDYGKDFFCIGFLEKSNYGRTDNFKGVIGISDVKSHTRDYVGRITGNSYSLTTYEGVVGYKYTKDSVSAPAMYFNFNTVDLLLPFFALAE